MSFCEGLAELPTLPADLLRLRLLRERWIVDGELSDSALYGLLARNWRGRQSVNR